MDTIFPREQIAIAFIGQFNEKGPDASLSAVAKELHISKKTIYRYFKSKDDIYLFFLNRDVAYVKAQDAEIQADPSLSTEEKLRKTLLVQFRGETRIDAGKALLLKKSNPRVYKAFGRAVEECFKPFVALLEEGKANGTLRKDLRTGFFIALLKEGYFMLFKEGFLKRNNLSYDEAYVTLADGLVQGCLARKEK
jgi:AcrR family transcriptional regulator